MNFRVILILLLSIVEIEANSQAYYGKKGFGKFELINDSICTVSFTDIPGWPLYHIVDTCSYDKKNDTIYITTKVKNRFEVIQSDSAIKITRSEPILLKVYKKINNNYILTSEYLHGIQLDTSQNLAVISNIHFSKGDIFVFYYFGCYTRLKLNTSYQKYLIIKFNDIGLKQVTYFDSFPIVVRKNRIVPIKGTKQNQCWIENGFYFPKMKYSKQEKEYYGIPFNRIGIMGLKNNPRSPLQ